MQLNAARAVDEVEERGLAVAPPRGDAPGDPVAVVGLLARGEPLVSGPDHRDVGPPLERVRERLDAGLAQSRQLGTPLREQLRLGALCLVGLAHRASESMRLRSW